MIHDLNLVKAFHEKFEVPVLSKPSLISADRAKLRFNLMQEEVKEYLDGVENRDIENVAKELADILYVVYGTILEHGLQDKMDEIFEEVHRSNMSKSYHKYKMVKGEDYRQADLSSFFKESED
ncbi:MAG: nucleoside triphosphate pyrophosphohydrolase family protein [Candidatus Woesearchaeota archaeon]